MIKPFKIILTLVGLILVNCNTHSTHEIDSWRYSFFIDSGTIGAIKVSYKIDYPNGDIGYPENHRDGKVGIYKYDIASKKIILLHEEITSKIEKIKSAKYSGQWLIYSWENISGNVEVFKHNINTNLIQKFDRINEGIYNFSNNGKYGISNNSFYDLENELQIGSFTDFPFYINDSASLILSTENDKYTPTGHIFRRVSPSSIADTMITIDTNYLSQCKVVRNNSIMMFKKKNISTSSYISTSAFISNPDTIKNMADLDSIYLAYSFSEMKDFNYKNIIFVGDNCVYLYNSEADLVDTILLGYERVIN